MSSSAGPPRRVSEASRWQRVRELFDAIVDLPSSEREHRLDEWCAGDPELRNAVLRLLQHDTTSGDAIGQIVAAAASEAVADADAAAGAGASRGVTDAADLSHTSDPSSASDASPASDESDTSAASAASAAPDAPRTPGASRVAGATGSSSRRTGRSPRTIGRYRLIDRIGAGGMGEVFLAEDTSLGRRVAIKLPPAALSGDPRIRQRLQREARAAATLNHPHVCVVHEVGDGPDDRPFIAMEFVHGETLTARIQRGPLPAEELLALGRQAASALQAAHAEGIVHRDLKPSNIMCTAHGIKLLDFGLASAARDDAFADNALPADGFMGTVPYMSPEQVRSERVDARTDLYSLGVVLYEAATGRLPFDGATRRAMCEAILTREPVPPTQLAPDLPAGVDRVILRALAKSRDARYPSAAALSADLSASLRPRAPATAAPSDTASAHPVAVGSTSDSAPASTPPSTSAAALAAALPAGTSASSPATSPRRLPWMPRAMSATRGAIAATLLIAALIAAAVITTQLRGRPAVTPPPAEVAILLADFTNATGDAAFDGTLRQALVVQLQQTPFLRVFPQAGVQETLRLMARAPDTRLTDSVAQDIARRRGLGAWISGGIAPEGAGFVISLVATRGDGGEVIARERVSAADKSRVLPALGTTATRLRERLGESLQSIGQFNAPIQQATTASIDALKAYTLAGQQAQRGDYAMAVALYERAVQIDPEFAMAFQALAREQANGVYPREVIAASATRAYQLRTRATEQERFSIESRYHVGVAGDLERAIATVLQWKATYPGDWRPYHSLGDLYFSIGRYEDAAESSREAVRLNPDVAAAYSNLAASLFALNRFEEARGVYRQAMTRGLDAPEYHAFLWRIGYYLQDEEEMRRQIDWAGASSTWAFNMPALAAGLQGRWQMAQQSSRQASTMFARLGQRGLVGMAARYEAMTGVLVGDCAHTRRSVARGLGASAGNDDQARLVLAAALCGDFATASAFVERTRRAFPQDTMMTEVWLPAIAAAVALRRGQPADAVTALRAMEYETAAESWSGYVRGLSLLESGAGVEAEREFQAIVQHPGRAFWFPLAPVARLGVARAKAIAGDAAGARRAYEAFFAAWPQADPSLPVLVQARKEYAALP